MVPKSLRLLLALLVFVSACAPPLAAAPRARKPRRGHATADTQLAQAPTTPVNPAQTTPPVVSTERTRTTTVTTESTSSTSVVTRPPRLGEGLLNLKAPPPEEVRGAVPLTPQTTVGAPVRVNPNGERIPDVLRLYPNESKIIKVEGLKRVSITNQGIADVVIVSPDEIMVLPNQGGTGGRTSAYFWDKDGRKEIRIVVIARTEESAISEQIQADINLPGLTVDYINNRIIIRGKVRNSAERQYALDIAGLYGAPILPIIEVQGIALDPKEALIKLLNLPDVKITVVNTALQASQTQLNASGQPINPAAAGQASPTAPAAPAAGQAPLIVGANNPGNLSASTSPSPATPAAGGPTGLSQIGQLSAPPSATVMVLLEGTVDDEQDKAKADEITKAFFNSANPQGAFGQQAAVIINHIEVLKPVQVMVEGMLLEFNNTNQKQMDFKWGTNPGSGQPGAEIASPPSLLPDNQQNTLNFLETPVAQTFGQFTHTGGEASHGDYWPPFPFPVQRFFRTDPLLVNVRWAISNNKAKLLASPKIVTRSGQAATINVGGTIPLQTAAGLGATAIQLLRFGTLMRITPTVDHRGNIDTQVNISVSDAQGVAGATRNRDTDTRVTVKDGQHIVVSGLVQDSEQLVVSKVPFFGDIPWLGRLFRTSTTNKLKTELVAIVTPRLLDSVQKDEMFGDSKFGDVSPTDADMRAANKGAKPARLFNSSVGAPPIVGATALEKARQESEARVAKLHSSGKPGTEGQLTDQQKHVRELFAKIKADDGTGAAATSSTKESKPSVSADTLRPETPSPAAVYASVGLDEKRSVNTDTTRVPLMTASPLANDLADPGPFVPTAGQTYESSVPPVAQESSESATTQSEGQLVASAAPEPEPAPESAATAPAASGSIERVSKKIDDLFDRLDEKMQGTAH